MSGRIVVVGAGIAGLSCARALCVAGHQVTVLEGRDRIGGRTHTVDLAGATVDLGGSWIHGPVDNPIMEPIRKAGISTINDGVWGFRMAVHQAGHEWMSGPQVATLVAAQADFEASEAATALGGDGSFEEGASWYVHNRGLTGLEAELARFSIAWLAGGLNEAGTPDRVSLAGVAAYIQHRGGNLLPNGGYRSLVEHLASGLDIRTGTPVLRIDHDTVSAKAITPGSAWAADWVVITVPLGALQADSIEFRPAISQAHQAAIDRLAMGTLEKVVFRFEQPIWPAEVGRLIHISPDQLFPLWTVLPGQPPTIMGFYNPRCTPGMTEVPHSQRLHMAMDVLRSMFGANIPSPVASAATNWSDDPFACGSYSFIPVGAVPEDMAVLATPPAARLVLAGEHTVIEHHGTVHGAYASGLRAAQTVIQAG
jgi:monoamine oxidase